MKYLFLMIFLLGCNQSHECVDSFSSGGMGFCIQYDASAEPINKNIIEDIVEIIELSAQKYYSHIVNVRDMLDNYNVTVLVTEFDIVRYCHKASINDVMVCEEDLGGINSRSDFILIESPFVKNCFFYSPLMHEILHTVDDVYLGGSNHNTPYMFGQNYYTNEEKQNTIESNANTRMRERSYAYPDDCSEN